MTNVTIESLFSTIGRLHIQVESLMGHNEQLRKENEQLRKKLPVEPSISPVSELDKTDASVNRDRDLS